MTPDKSSGLVETAVISAAVYAALDAVQAVAPPLASAVGGVALIICLVALWRAGKGGA